MAKTKKNESGSSWIWVYFIVIILLGFIGLVLFIQQRRELRRKKNETLKNLQQALRVVEDQQKALKLKKEELDREFKRSFLLVRITIFALWFALQVFLCLWYGLMVGITNALAINAFLISTLFVVNFLLFGNVTDMEVFVERSVMVLRNRVYRKYLHIDNDLLAYDDKKREIISNIEALKQEIEEMEKKDVI